MPVAHGLQGEGRTLESYLTGNLPWINHANADPTNRTRLPLAVDS
jgi:hypothetical protein